MRKPPAALRAFLKAYDPAVGRLFLAARAAVLAAAPKADELIYDAYNAVAAAYTFSDRLKEAFCHVAAYSGHVNLGFNRGAKLPDPDGILVGSGTSIRHVRIGAAADLKQPAVKRMIRAAVAEGRTVVRDSKSNARSLVLGSSAKKKRPKAKR
jgi:hypothetical protein